jgi:hypothetical protein
LIDQNEIQSNGNKINVESVSLEGSEGLRVLARLIARRLQREALAKEKNARQTIMLGAESQGQEARQ